MPDQKTQKIHRPSIPAYGEKPDVTKPQTSPTTAVAWQGAAKYGSGETAGSLARTEIPGTPERGEAEWAAKNIQQRGPRIKSFKHGGMVKNTGVYKLHAGEMVVSKPNFKKMQSMLGKGKE